MVGLRAARDVLVVLLCAADTAVQAIMTYPAGQTQLWLVIVLGTVATVAMWWRRRYPLAVGGRSRRRPTWFPRCCCRSASAW